LALLSTWFLITHRLLDHSTCALLRHLLIADSWITQRLLDITLCFNASADQKY